MTREIQISRGDVSLAVSDRGGDRPPLLLLHGLAGSSRELIPTADALAASYRVLLGRFFASWPSTFRDASHAREFLGGEAIAAAWVDDLEATPGGLRPRLDPDVIEHTIRAVHAPRWQEWEQLTVPTLAVFAARGMFTHLEKDELLVRRPGGARTAPVRLSVRAAPAWSMTLMTAE